MIITEEQLNSNADYFLKIQINNQEGLVQELINQDTSSILIFSDGFRDLCERFTGNPKEDINSLYLKYYQKDVVNIPAYYIGADLPVLKKMLPDVGEENFPIIFITNKGNMEEVIILNDVNLF